MPRNKTHKGLLKRVRITKSGRIKMRRAFGRHHRSHKPASRVRRYRRPKYLVGPDAQRLRRLLRLPASTGQPAPEAPLNS